MCYGYEDEKEKKQEERQIQAPQEHVEQIQEELPMQEVLPAQEIEADPLRDFVMVEQMEAEPRTVRERLKCKIEVRQEINDREDSRYMQAVKRALASLSADTEHAMLPGGGTIDLTRDRDGLHNKLNAIEEKYRTAIEECETYLEKREPTFFASLHKRYQSVKNTKKLLTQELGYVTKLRHDIAENPENYQGKEKVSFLDLAYELRKRNESVQRLEMKDYVKMLTDKEEDSLVCRNGQLYRKDSKAAGSNPDGRTSENFDMLDRFVTLILERQNSFSEISLKKIRRNLLQSLGADLGEKTAGPVNMGKLRELVVRFNRQVSEVDRRLLEKKEDSLAYQTASGIQELLGSAFLRGKNQKEADLELQRRQQIAAIQEVCKENPDYVTLNLSKQEITTLVKGQLQAARDKAFQSAMKIYRMRERFGERPAKPLEEQELQLLLGMALSQVVTEKEDVKATLELQLRRFEIEQALKADDGLSKDLQLLNIEELRTMEPDAVRLYVEKHPNLWQGMAEAERKSALKALTRLMENMQEMNTLVYKGLMQGLTPDESALFQKRLEENQRVFGRNRTGLDKLRQGFPEGSAMAEGLKKLYMRGELTGFGAKTDLATRIAGKLAEERQAGEQQEEAPKTLQLISEEEAFAEALKDFPKKIRLRIKSVFLDKKHSKLIKKRGDNASQSLLQLMEAFWFLTEPENAGRSAVSHIRFQRYSMDIRKDREGILTIECEGHKVTLPHTASYWLESLEEDLCTHFKRYRENDAKEVLLRTVARDSAKPEGERRSRVTYERFLTYEIGARAEDLAPLTNQELRELTRSYCTLEGMTKEQILGEVQLRSAKQTERIYINSKAAVENLIALEKLKQERGQAQVIKKENALEIVNDPQKWSAEEKSFLNLMGEFFFSSKSKLTLDQDATYTADRLKEVLRSNKQDFLTVANMNMAKRTEMAMRLQPFQAEFSQAVTVFNNFLASLGTYFFFRKGFAALTAEDLDEALESGGLDDMLSRTAGSMKAAVDGVSDFVQQHLDEAVNNMKEDDEDKDKTIHDYTLQELVEKSVTGNEGEGAFNKLVLSGYVRNASPAERQKMVACALKNVPKLTENDGKSERSIAIIMGKFMAGYVKGAGPLLHKMMQGLPISAMPTAMQEMVKDVRSNLMQIDEDIVDAQLQQIIDESDGAIDHIEKIKTLGSASVGQTLLVKVYESPESEGIEKVVKILKPDVQNSIARELAFMESCARKVDEEAERKARGGQAEGEAQQQVQAEGQAQQQVQAEGEAQEHVGGMLKTFRGKTAAIRRELDLRLEADNVEKGKIYEDELLHIRSMRVDTKTKSTIHALVLEKAPGQSVDNYMTDMNTKRKEIEEKVTKVNEGENMASVYGTVQELQELKKELEKKKKYLVNLTQKWLDEAIFKSGFFHGDLHAGNIMMDDDGVTVIDYGNANVLEKRDQKNILNLLASSMRFNNDRVMIHIKDMLRNSPESYQIFERKEEEISRVTKDIIKKEDGSPVDKILVVFHELQKREIEIPAGFYNFIQCFVRMIGTLTDYDAVIDNVDRSMVRVMEKRRFGNVEHDPEAQVMSPILENILSRYYDDDKNATSLDTVVDKAINSREYNPRPLIRFCETESTLFHKNDHVSNVRFSSRVIDVADRTSQILGKLFATEEVAKMTIKLSRGGRLNFEDCKFIEDEWYSLFNGVIGSQINVSIGNKANGRLQGKIEECEAEIEKTRDSLSTLEIIKGVFENSTRDYRQRLPHLEGVGKANVESMLRKDEQSLAEVLQKMEKAQANIAVQEERIRQHRQRQRENLEKSERLQDRAKAFHTQIRASFTHTNREARTFDEAAILAAVREGIDIWRETVITLGDNEYEQKFLQEFFDYNMNPVSKNRNDEDELGILTEEEKELRRQKNEEAARCKERFIQAANELHQRSNPKSYRDHVEDAVLNPARRVAFGETLADWFADEKAEGEALETAYNALVRAGAEAELTKESPEVTAFVEAFLTSLKKRVAAIEKIAAQKSGDVDDAEEALKGLVTGNLKRVLRTIGALDYTGLPYLFTYKLSQREKDDIETGKKERKTRRMKPLFDSLKTAELKDSALELNSASSTYTRVIRMSQEPGRELVTEEQKRQAKQNLEKAIQNVMANIAKLEFGKTEKKLLEEYMGDYQEEPTAGNLLAVIREAGLYLNRVFKGTDYDAPNPNPNQQQAEIRYLSQIFDPALTKLSILPGDEILELGYEKKLGQDGKEIPLFERLKAGEKIQWLKKE